MAITKRPADFLESAREKAEQYECFLTSDCASALHEDIESSINAISDDVPVIWEDLIETGLGTFVIYMIIKAKEQGTSELNDIIFNEARAEFLRIWPCPRMLAEGRMDGQSS